MVDGSPRAARPFLSVELGSSLLLMVVLLDKSCPKTGLYGNASLATYHAATTPDASTASPWSPVAEFTGPRMPGAWARD